MITQPQPVEPRGVVEHELLELFRQLDKHEQREAFADLLRRVILTTDPPAILRRQAE